MTSDSLNRVPHLLLQLVADALSEYQDQGGNMSKLAEGALKMALKKEEEGAAPEVIDKWLEKAVEYEAQGR